MLEQSNARCEASVPDFLRSTFADVQPASPSGRLQAPGRRSVRASVQAVGGQPISDTTLQYHPVPVQLDQYLSTLYSQYGRGAGDRQRTGRYGVPLDLRPAHTDLKLRPCTRRERG